MSRSVKSISYDSTPKSRSDQRSNHHIIRAVTREVLSKIDIDNVENVDVIIPTQGRESYDLVDHRSRMSFHPIGSSFWKYQAPEDILGIIAAGRRK